MPNDEGAYEAYGRYERGARKGVVCNGTRHSNETL